MGEARILFGITIFLGLVIDVLIRSVTLQLWREVHEVVVDLTAEVGWVERILWWTVDGLIAALVIGGIGILLAAAVVYPAYYRLTGRR